VLPVRIAFGSVVLRHFAPDDAPRVAELCAAREVAEMTSLVPHPYTEAMAREWIAAQDDDATEHTYAVLRRTDEVLVGAFGLRPHPRSADMIGYWIGVPYWGRGYATAALATGLALAFTRLELELVQATHLVRNPASGRVMEKCGMHEVDRQMRSHRGGPPEPVLVRALAREPWQARIERGE
jgi:RimJ/RimL family protein N-acetyltransferase